MAATISTARRIEYTQGYLTLGLLEEAAAEWAAIPPDERDSDHVLDLTIDLHTQRREWELAAGAAQRFTGRYPNDPRGWIAWAFAVRRWKNIPAAEDILLEAEQHVGLSCALLHYNLACYRCQLGDLVGARSRLLTAVSLDANWRQTALTDPDLGPLWKEIPRLGFQTP